MIDQVKLPGEIWWACHPWFSRARFLQSDGSPVTTRSLQRHNARIIEMECKAHPVLILGPGDEKKKGYLVCYFSSQSLETDVITRQRLRGVEITEGKESFIFRMAPCYCADEFIWKRIKTTDENLMELVKGILKRACSLTKSQSWESFGFAELVPHLDSRHVEEVRTALAAVFDAFQHHCQKKDDVDKDPMAEDFETAFDAAVSKR